LEENSLMQLQNKSYLSEFLSKLFDRLNSENITYCILRNYVRLPEDIGNDVDMWVDKKDWGKFHHSVKDVAYALNYTLNYTPRLTVKGEGNYFLSKFVNEKLQVIHIDSWAYLHWKGLCFINESVIGKYLKWNERGFFIPSPGVEASINLLKELIYHGRIKEKYKEKIKEYALKDSAIFLECVKKSFGRKTSLFIFECAQNGDWQMLEKNYIRLRIVLFLRGLLSPFSQFIKFFYYSRAQVRRFFTSPYGLFIVLIGPDGSGKSTTSKNLIESEIKKLFQKKLYFHGHFPFLPELRKIVAFLRGKKIDMKDITNPASSKPMGFWRSMIYPIYYGVNYFLGHFFIWKEKARAGLIVFDRYFYDYMIQNIYANCPRWLLYVIASLIPKPDIVIYLKNRPEVIFSRKPELTIDEIKRQSEICENLVKKLKNCYVVQTNSEDETLIQIQNIIIKRR